MVENPIFFWVGVMMITAEVIFEVVRYRKKRKKIPWPNIEVAFQVTSRGLSAEDWYELVKKKQFAPYGLEGDDNHNLEYLKGFLGQISFSPPGKSYELLVIEVSELDRDEYPCDPTTDGLYARAGQLGLVPPPPEAALLLWELLSDVGRPSGIQRWSWLHVMNERNVSLRDRKHILAVADQRDCFMVHPMDIHDHGLWRKRDLLVFLAPW